MFSTCVDTFIQRWLLCLQDSMPKLALLLLLPCLILPLANFRSVWFIYLILVRLPGFAWHFYCQLCLCVFVFLRLSVSPLFLSISPKPNLTLNMPACWPAARWPVFPLPSLTPSLSLSRYEIPCWGSFLVGRTLLLYKYKCTGPRPPHPQQQQRKSCSY